MLFFALEGKNVSLPKKQETEFGQTLKIVEENGEIFGETFLLGELKQKNGFFVFEVNPLNIRILKDFSDYKINFSESRSCKFRFKKEVAEKIAHEFLRFFASIHLEDHDLHTNSKLQSYIYDNHWRKSFSLYKLIPKEKLIGSWERKWFHRNIDEDSIFTSENTQKYALELCASFNEKRILPEFFPKNLALQDNRFSSLESQEYAMEIYKNWQKSRTSLKDFLNLLSSKNKMFSSCESQKYALRLYKDWKNRGISKALFLDFLVLEGRLTELSLTKNEQIKKGNRFVDYFIFFLLKNELIVSINKSVIRFLFSPPFDVTNFSFVTILAEKAEDFLALSKEDYDFSQGPATYFCAIRPQGNLSIYELYTFSNKGRNLILRLTTSENVFFIHDVKYCIKLEEERNLISFESLGSYIFFVHLGFFYMKIFCFEKIELGRDFNSLKIDLQEIWKPDMKFYQPSFYLNVVYTKTALCEEISWVLTSNTKIKIQYFHSEKLLKIFKESYIEIEFFGWKLKTTLVIFDSSISNGLSKGTLSIYSLKGKKFFLFAQPAAFTRFFNGEMKEIKPTEFIQEAGIPKFFENNIEKIDPKEISYDLPLRGETIATFATLIDQCNASLFLPDMNFVKKENYFVLCEKYKTRFFKYPGGLILKVFFARNFITFLCPRKKNRIHIDLQNSEILLQEGGKYVRILFPNLLKLHFTNEDGIVLEHNHKKIILEYKDIIEKLTSSVTFCKLKILDSQVSSLKSEDFLEADLVLNGENKIFNYKIENQTLKTCETLFLFPFDLISQEALPLISSQTSLRLKFFLFFEKGAFFVNANKYFTCKTYNHGFELFRKSKKFPEEQKILTVILRRFSVGKLHIDIDWKKEEKLKDNDFSLEIEDNYFSLCVNKKGQIDFHIPNNKIICSFDKEGKRIFKELPKINSKKSSVPINALILLAGVGAVATNRPGYLESEEKRF